jgi:hypothetical protein
VRSWGLSFNILGTLKTQRILRILFLSVLFYLKDFANSIKIVFAGRSRWVTEGRGSFPFLPPAINDSFFSFQIHLVV